MKYRIGSLLSLSLLLVLSAIGCRSPYRSDQGALFGGLTGAGLGAIVGDSAGNAGAGAAIGAAAGALTGAVVGEELDQIEAHNRAMIEQQYGRRVAAGAVSVGEVVSMSNAGVNDELIRNHIRAHGMQAALQTSDLISLQQQGVSTEVIKAMQEPPRAPVVVQQPAVQPVIVEEYHYGPPLWGPGCRPYPHYGRRHGHSGVSWGLSVGH